MSCPAIRGGQEKEGEGTSSGENSLLEQISAAAEGLNASGAANALSGAR
jgi:hypothetical protein